MVEMTEIKKMTSRDELDLAHEGSWYFIAGAGGDLQEWVDGYTGMMREGGIGEPKEWWQASGALVNEYAGANFLEQRGDPFQPDVTCLLFPLIDLDISRLALFKLRMQDRWFDDVIDNMRRRIG
jgi:hypothetical protein